MALPWSQHALRVRSHVGVHDGLCCAPCLRTGGASCSSSNPSCCFPTSRPGRESRYSLYELPRTARRDRALVGLARARVGHLVGRIPSSLSGGGVQRDAIAQALASEPWAVLLDEPFSAPDGALRHDLGAEYETLVVELRIPAVLVTHHQEDAVSLDSRVLGFKHGRVSAGASWTAAFAPAPSWASP
jgi:ABC-type Fe3+/spermidine/putrescine transport system ATPase subunit